MQKIFIMLVIAATSLTYSITLSGYNHCYIHTDVGFENLNFSNLQTHIDSSYDVVNDSIDSRNEFSNGYISHTDWDGGMDFIVRNDSSIYYYQGNPFMGLIFNDEKLIRKFGPSLSHVSYYPDSIIDVDTVGVTDKEYYRTKNRFVNDSMYNYLYDYNNDTYILNSKCKASANECDCGMYKYVFYSNYIEKYVDLNLTKIYFISGGIPTVLAPALKRKMKTNQIKIQYDLIGRAKE